MIGVKRERRDGDAPATTGDLTAFLDRGSRFEGKLHFDGHVRINGEFKGDIRAEGTLVVGEGAALEAQVSVDTLVVSGSITGDVVARARVELHAPARVVGNITTPVLVIEEGSIFEGQCHMEGVAAGRNGASGTEIGKLSADAAKTGA